MAVYWHLPTKSYGPGGSWVGIRGDSVLVPWRPFFWIDAEVVQIAGPLRSPGRRLPLRSHSVGTQPCHTPTCPAAPAPQPQSF